MFYLSPHDVDIFIRLFAATVLGSMIGFEREFHGKGAGFRTYTLVCLGSALVMILSIEIFEIYKSSATNVDPGRMAAQVVTGIGFLGAGAIIRSPQGISGLTTAAGIWAGAGIGLACGMAQYKPAFFATVLVLIVLMFFAKVDRYIHHSSKKKA